MLCSCFWVQITIPTPAWPRCHWKRRLNDCDFNDRQKDTGTWLGRQVTKHSIAHRGRRWCGSGVVGKGVLKHTWRVHLESPGWQGQVLLKSIKRLFVSPKVTNECFLKKNGHWISGHIVQWNTDSVIIPLIVFPDSDVKTKVHWGRTKEEILITNGLASYNVELILVEINEPLCFSYSVSSDGAVTAMTVIKKGPERPPPNLLLRHVVLSEGTWETADFSVPSHLSKRAYIFPLRQVLHPQQPGPT